MMLFLGPEAVSKVLHVFFLNKILFILKRVWQRAAQTEGARERERGEARRASHFPLTDSLFICQQCPVPS